MKTLSPRFGLQRWSNDADTQQRSEFDNDNGQIDALAVKGGHGTIGARPAPTAEWADGLWLITDAAGGGVVGTLYYCDGAAWTAYPRPTQGLFAGRPAAALAGRRFYATDQDKEYLDDGAGWHQVLTDTAGLARAEVVSAKVATSESTTSVTFADLATVGPAIAVNIGAAGRALVLLDMQSNNSSVGQFARMAFAVSGATVRAAVASEGPLTTGRDGAAFDTNHAAVLVTGLTPGVNTFTAKYAVSAGSGLFIERRIIVIPL